MYEWLRILGHKIFFNWVKGILVSSLLDFSFHYLFHKISIHLAQRCSAQKKTCSIPNNVIYVCTSSTFNSFLMTRSSWRIWFTVNSTTELPNFQSTVCKHEIAELVYPCRGNNKLKITMLKHKIDYVIEDINNVIKLYPVLIILVVHSFFQVPICNFNGLSFKTELNILLK